MKSILKTIILALLVSIAPAPMRAMEEQPDEDQVLRIPPIDAELMPALKVAGEQAIAGNLEPLRALLQNGLNANQAFNALIEDRELEKTPAHAEEFVKLLLEFDFVIDVAENRNFDCTPLKLAIARSFTPLMQALIKHGANVNYCGRKGYASPLMTAAYNDQYEAALLLVDHGADVNLITAGTNCALSAASYWGRSAIVKLIIERGAIAQGDGLWWALRNGLHHAPDTVDAKNYKQVIKLLIKCGFDTNFDAEDQSCLDLAIMADNNEVEIIELLLNHHANPNFKRENGNMPLLRACQTPYWRQFVKIINRVRGIEFFCTDNLIQNDFDCVQLLLDYGAAIDAPDQEGMTALMYVAGRCIPTEIRKLVETLKDQGRYFTKQEERDELHADLDLTPLAKLLLDHGANRDLKNNEGQTARDIAELHGNTAMVELLDSHNLWGASGLKLKAARAVLAKCAALDSEKTKALIASIPEDLRPAVILIAPKAIKDKIGEGSVQNSNND